MTPTFYNRVHDRLASLAADKLSSFSPIGLGSDPRVVGLWRRRGRVCSFFILVAGPTDRNAVTADVAWDVNIEFPWRQRYQRVMDESGIILPEAVASAPVRTRLDRLWGSRRDFWWGQQRLTSGAGLEKLRQLKDALDSGEGAPTTGGTLVRAALDALNDNDEAIRWESPENISLICGDIFDKVAEYALPYFELVSAEQDKASR